MLTPITDRPYVSPVSFAKNEGIKQLRGRFTNEAAFKSNVRARCKDEYRQSSHTYLFYKSVLLEMPCQETITLNLQWCGTPQLIDCFVTLETVVLNPG